jgi:hypothetical protein
MDLRVALITGTVFLGVLAGGALAAPKLSGAHDGSASVADQQPSEAVVTAAAVVDIPAVAVSHRESDERDDDHDGGDHRGREHEEDDD